jgi:prepilin-type N-terminal cleavage/methylation domain-containing protein
VSSDVAAPRGREGFTLVEVLVAMVILAIGLLALEALGIGASRAVARADLQSEYTSLATARMEETLLRVRQGLPLNTGVTQVGNTTVTTTVAQAAVGTRQQYTVTVNVAPRTSANLRLQSVNVVAREIR